MKQKLEKITFYINCFFVYCMIGWLYEIVCVFYWGYGFVNRGFLYGPYLPIYGFCALFFILLFHKLAAQKISIHNVTITPILIFCAVMILSTFIEYLASYMLENIWHMRFWDYSSYKYNLNGRIALVSSLLFGLGGLGIFYVVQPLLNKLRRWFDDKVTIILGLSVLSMMMTDFILTLTINRWQIHF